jgi:hypothetical protein
MISDGQPVPTSVRISPLSAHLTLLGLANMTVHQASWSCVAVCVKLAPAGRLHGR